MSSLLWAFSSILTRMKRGRSAQKILGFFIISLLSVALASCSQLLGWGVLLWSIENPDIPSGSILPVYIRSNIDNVWVVGIPNPIEGESDKMELPLWKLELVGTKAKAKERAAAFQEYANVYAEVVQDGLPIRAEADNSARRIYKLRLGQIVKVLSKSEGAPAVSGDQSLPGEWLSILTDDGTSGYCFSYRLKLFVHEGGPLTAAPLAAEALVDDPKLDLLLSKSWRPEWYKELVNARRIELERFSEAWGFFPGQDIGIARLAMPNLDLSYPYTSISKVREGVWRFEGSPFQVTLRSDNLLSLQYTDEGGASRTLLFVTLPAEVSDLVTQEQERRATVFRSLFEGGPIFRSENYGTLAFSGESGFSWTRFDLLVPSIIPASARGAGNVEFRLFLNKELQEAYTGALSFHFAGMKENTLVHFLYVLEPNGLRLEQIPESSLDGAVVLRRSSAPTVIYFSRSER